MALKTQVRFRTIAEELEAAITAGQWPVGHRLPSVRGIAKKNNVALATAARALEVLHGKGVLKRDERSGIYRVAGAANGTADHWAVCLRVTPGLWQRASIAVTNGGFVEMAQNPDVHLAFDAIPTDLDLPETTLRHMVDQALQAGITGLFFMPARINDAMMAQDERLLAVCRERGLPVVLIERNLRGDQRPLEWDLVCPDDVDGGYQCAMHLFATGRKNLAFVRGGPTSSHNDQLAGFLMAHVQARQRGLLPAAPPFPAILEYPDDSSSKEAYHALCDQILGGGVDGVVTYQDRVAIGLAIELMARGQQVPADVALTGFDDQPIGQEFTLGVTSYAYPGHEIALRAFALMRQRIKNPAAPPVKLVVPSRLVVRESSVASP